MGVGALQGQRLLSLGSEPAGPPVAQAARFDPVLGLVTVQVDLDLVRSGPSRLELPTSDGRVLVAERSVFEDRGSGNVMWAGSLPGAGYESVVLTVEDGSFVGRFGEPGGASFRISADADGRGRMVDTAAAPSDAPETFCPVGVEPDGLSRFGPMEPRRVDLRQRVASPQNHDQLDILVLYTAEAARNWGNRGGAVASIRNAGDYLNLVLRNGQLPIEANIVHIARAPAALDAVAREGVGPYGSNLLTQLLWNGEVLQLRGRHNADLVHLFTGESTRLLQFCGRAYLLTRGFTADDFSRLALGWSANTCSTYDDAQIFAHEVGHGLGANHDPANATGGEALAVEPYAFGHFNHDHIPNVGTVMSYRGQVEPYFSSVRIRPGRRTIGIAGERENERVLRRTMRLGASYSDALQTPPEAAPAALTNVRVEVIGAASARVSWVDNSDDEEGFQVWVQRLDEPFAVGRSVGADQESFEVDDLEPGFHFFWVTSHIGSARSWRTSFVDAVLPGAEPAAPSDLRVTPILNVAFFSWTDNSDDETGFLVSAWVSGWSGTFAVDADTESFEIRGLARGGRYRFSLVSDDGERFSAASNTVTVALGVGGRGPRAPRRLRSTPIDSYSAHLTWVDDSTDELGFEIQVRLVGGTWERAALVGAGVEAFPLKDRPYASVEDYRVFAFNDSGFSASSNVVTLTLPKGDFTSEIRATPSGNSAVDLKWFGRWLDRSLGPLTVEGRNPESDWVELVTAEALAGSVQVTGLMTDTPYTFRLVSKARGSRFLSEEASTTTGAFRDACRSGGRYLCLGDGRFEVQAHWTNPDMTGDYGFGAAIPVDISDESGLFWFFEPDNVELVIKVLDGRALNGNFWVFFGALSDVEYWVTVEDTRGRQRRTYHNPPMEICGQGDVAAFSGGGLAARLSAPAGVPAQPGIDLVRLELVSLAAAGAGRPQEAGGQCEPGEELLCLLDNRFSVEVSLVDPNVEPPLDPTKRAKVAPSLTTANTGFFWFFNPENIEPAVKVLDGRALNGSFWFLYGGLSDVEYKMTVEDTVTGSAAGYTNKKGSICGHVDTGPF